MILVNDMVTGIRTIKSYAWENHYMNKIKSIRAIQHINVQKFNLVGSLGFTLFANAGLIVVILIFVPKWFRGEAVDTERAFSLLAMIYYLFFVCVALSLMTMTTLSQLSVMFQRLGDVFKMEEYNRERIEDVNPEQVSIKIDYASFSWGFKVKEN